MEGVGSEWGGCGGGDRGAEEEAERRGVQKLRVGQRWMAIFSFPHHLLLLSLSLLLVLTLSYRSRLQQRWCGSWKSCKIHRSWALIKRRRSAFKINLSVGTQSACRDAEGNKAQGGDGWMRSSY